MTIGGASGHCSEEESVDFDDFFDCLGGDVTASCCSRIGAYYHTSGELESQACCTVVEFDFSAFDVLSTVIVDELSGVGYGFRDVEYLFSEKQLKTQEIDEISRN